MHHPREAAVRMVSGNRREALQRLRLQVGMPEAAQKSVTYSKT
ncbi:MULTISPECIES: hypothetical protein [Cupriavidus]